MKCPFCGHLENKVVESRINQSGDLTRRRRECLSCDSRFTTYERVEELMPLVIKKDGRREEFNREKIMDGIRKSCQKRQFTVNDFEDMVRSTEQKIKSLGVKEIPSDQIGKLVMELLRTKDKVAYIRFASVYRDFKDVEEFMCELQKAAEPSTTEQLQ